MLPVPRMGRNLLPGYAAGMSWLLLLLACPKAPVPTPVVPAPAPVAAPPVPAPGFGPLEEQVSRMLASADQGDQLDRLVILQEMLLKTRGMDAEAQRVLYVYADQMLKIEQRNLPMPVAEPDASGAVSIVAPENLTPIQSSSAEIEAWLEGEQRRANELLVEATRLEGDARLVPMRKAKEILEKAAGRFPDAARAADMQHQVEQIQRDLTEAPADPD